MERHFLCLRLVIVLLGSAACRQEVEDRALLKNTPMPKVMPTRALEMERDLVAIPMLGAPSFAEPSGRSSQADAQGFAEAGMKNPDGASDIGFAEALDRQSQAGATGFAEAMDTLYVDRSPVTVGQFAVFAEATGYRTQAEEFGNAGVFDFKQKVWKLSEGGFGESLTAKPARVQNQRIR